MISTRVFILLIFVNICIIRETWTDEIENSEVIQKKGKINEENLEIKPHHVKSNPIFRKNRNKKTAHNPRKNEIEEFFVKVEDSLGKFKNGNIKNSEELFSIENLRDLIGDGKYLIIFDCKRPSYMDLKGRKNNIKSAEVLRELKLTSNCSTTDNLWLQNGEIYSPKTYDHKNMSLAQIDLPFRQLANYFKELNICNEFMQFIKHPGYFLRNYKKPNMCQTGIFH